MHCTLILQLVGFLVELQFSVGAGGGLLGVRGGLLVLPLRHLQHGLKGTREESRGEG